MGNEKWMLGLEVKKRAQSRRTGFSTEFSSIQSLSSVCLFMTPRTAGCQASLSITNSQSLLKLMSIEWVMPSNHLILCHLLLLPSIFPSTGLFKWVSSSHQVAKVLAKVFNIIPSNEYWGLISLGCTGWISLLSKGFSRVFSNTTVQKHQFFSDQLSLESNSHIHTWLLQKP